MTEYVSSRIRSINTYVPGEQPGANDKSYIKLNTNEFPFSPSPEAGRIIKNLAMDNLRLYPDPAGSILKSAIADFYTDKCKISIKSNNIFLGNGSDEVLSCSFRAFFDEGDSVRFPNITYGFYKVYAALYGLKAEEIPLKEDFTIDISDYCGLKNGNIFIANPNAPTGLCLELFQIEEIIKNNASRLVVIDEAYIDFGGESCIPLIEKYDNLLVVKTFSKSRGLAGIRLGYGIGNEKIISALEKVKFSLNPYNINGMTMQIGTAVMKDSGYFYKTTGLIVNIRDAFIEKLRVMKFDVLDSKANFVFARNKNFSGKQLYAMLRENGILVRHFDEPLINEFIRISIGTEDQMDKVIEVLKSLL